MHPITVCPFTVAGLLLLLFFFFSGDVNANVDTFSNCNQTFNCGSLRNISYPFTGGDRPGHCGLPELQLACINNLTELTIDLLKYRVLGLDPFQHTLTLAQLDLWNETCPLEFANTTIDSDVFSSGSGSGNNDLTMFYKCNTSTLTVKPDNNFKCENYGSSLSSSYFLVGPVPFDPILAIIKCSESVRVPILELIASKLLHNKFLLGEALMMGFNVNYTIPYADGCSKCLEFGGQCGFDSKSSKPICICGNQVCSVPGTFPKRNWIIGTFPKRNRIIAIVATVFGILIFSVGIVCYCKRECISSKARDFWKKEKGDDFDVEAFIRNYGSFAPKRYSYATVNKMTSSFAQKIGTGGFGAVFKGKLPDGRLVAVKLLNESKSNGEEFINEVASIGRTSHVNIVTLIGFCYERKKRALVYEYMPNGSLDNFIFNKESLNADCRLEWKTLYEIAISIARGLEYLHRGCNTRILHLDIKPQNILLDENFCPKISDFGLAKLWLRKESVVSMVGARGTIGYIAPEVFSRSFGGVSHKSDVYSYGMLVLEIIGGRKNFDSAVSHTSEIYYPNRICKDLEMGTEASILGTITEEEKELSMKMILVSFWCIQTNPSDRPAMNKVVDLLQGSLQSIEIPPKPYLFSPTRSP